MFSKAEAFWSCSVAKSCSTLWPHGLQYARLSCLSLSPGACANSCPLSWLCYLTISSFATPFLLLLPSVFPSNKFFSNELALCIRWPKYWNFNFSIKPSSEYTGLISFKIDWSDLLAVQGTLKSILQHHDWKASIFQCSAFFMVELSHLNLTTGKTIALTIRIFACKVMSLF